LTRRIARLFAPYRGRLAAVLGLIVISAGLGMVSPFLLRDILDHALPENDDKLLAWLWPDSDAERARHVLNQLLYAQRRQVGDAALFTGQKTLRLNRAVMTTDVGEFLDAMERSALEEAVGLYQGPFLDGFFLKGGVEFEQWVETQRGRFARQVLAALATLADRASAAGDRATVVRWRQQASELDPLDSTLALELVRALAAAGDRPGALRHARQHADVLQTQLGLPTDARMAQLVEELRRA